MDRGSGGRKRESKQAAEEIEMCLALEEYYCGINIIDREVEMLFKIKTTTIESITTLLPRPFVLCASFCFLEIFSLLETKGHKGEGVT